MRAEQRAAGHATTRSTPLALRLAGPDQPRPLILAASVSLCVSTAARAADPERTLLMPNGGHFVGELEFNAEFRPHGEGTEYSDDRSEYASGQWRDGKMHGRGEQTFSNGDRYVGEFVAGQRSGLGTATLADRVVYEGEWVDGRRSSLGVQWDKDGKVTHCGRWENDALVEKRPVPRSKIPNGARLSAAGMSLAFLLHHACTASEFFLHSPTLIDTSLFPEL